MVFIGVLKFLFLGNKKCNKWGFAVLYNFALN